MEHTSDAERNPMNKLFIAIVAIVAIGMTCALISCAKRQPATVDPGAAATTDNPPGAKSCPTPKADTAKPGAAFGRDSGTVGQLAEPVTAKVRVYPAAADKPSEARARIPAGTWLLPEEMLDKPY